MDYSLEEMYPQLSEVLDTDTNPAEEQTTYPEQDIFNSMADTVLGIVRTITTEPNSEKRDAAKNLLGNLLRAREQYYFAIAQAINPNIESVNDQTSLYRIVNTELYGSLTAILDADRSIESHRGIADVLALHPDENKVETLYGETVSPRALQSQITIAGSHAQERIQPYGGDMDLVEHVKVIAQTNEEAATHFAELLRSQMQYSYNTDIEGKKYTLYPNYISVSGTMHNGEPVLQHKWKPQEIMQGFKELLYSDGRKEIITLEEICNNPRNLFIEYTCFSEDDAFLVSKISMIEAETPDGDILFNSSVREHSPFQEIYFGSPEQFDLTAQTLDPDKFVMYLIIMANEVRVQENNIPPNQLKKMKRLYNFCKVQGDFTSVEAIESIFSNPVCQMHQLTNHFEVALEVEKRTGDSRPIQVIQSGLETIIENTDHPQAHDAREYLNQRNYKKLRAVVKNIINDNIGYELAKNEDLQRKITEVLRLKGGNHGTTRNR
jgi:hypothetical protein